MELVIAFMPEGEAKVRCNMRVTNDLRAPDAEPFEIGDTASGPGYITSLVLDGAIAPTGLSQEFVDMLGEDIRHIIEILLERELLKTAHPSVGQPVIESGVLAVG